VTEHPRPPRSTVRVFGIGAACGFVAGALVVAAIVSKYGTAMGAPPPRPLPASDVVRTDDGMADIDSPILEEALVPAPAPAATSGAATAPPVASTERSADPTATIVPPSPGELRDRDLTIPVEGIGPDQLNRSFEDRRSGTRTHEAIDILAPRNTPVKAVDDGTIARLFYSKQGGITVYQFDPSERFCYYYAHLERYADGLKEGAQVKKGQVIGYVGISGNAPKNAPHLHFAVFRLTAAKRWWEGTPIDPYDILRK
jgi:murein DD-endopeptidase MepM/ murein hydrolase activator NlpD